MQVLHPRMICRKLLHNPETTKKILLKYVRDNDVRGIQKLVDSDLDILRSEYSYVYNHQNILIIACNDLHSMENVTGRTIEGLIALGASCIEPTKNDHWEAIHYTALNANQDKMSVIIKHVTAKQLNSLVYCSKHISENYTFCPDKNVEKSYSNNALHILLKYGNRKKEFYACCVLLINSGIDVNQKDSQGKSPADIIQETDDEKLLEILKLSSKVQMDHKITFEMISQNEEAKFLSLDISEDAVNEMDGADENTSSCTLLQLCCLKGFISSVEYLLTRGACPNGIITKNQSAPIMIAVKEDHEEIFKLLISNPDFVLPEDILIKLQIKYKHFKNFSRVDKYMELILKYLNKIEPRERRKYLLYMDDLNRTALHYATHYRCSENILALLSMGAPLTVKDFFGYTPLHSIEPALLEKFFDKCIYIPEGDEDIKKVLYSLRNKKRQFSVEINYESLVVDPEDSEAPESEFLDHLIKSKHLRHLVNHPVISCYLVLKWQKFKWAFYVNLLLYLIVYVSLLFYGFAFTKYATASNHLLLFSIVLLFLRELTQIMIFRMEYIKRLDNILDLFLIGGIVYIIASGWFEILLNQNLLVAFSVVFLTSTLGIFLQLSIHPFFTVKVIILHQIFINFLKHMAFYMFPVLAFFTCFYMLSESKDNLFFQTLYDVITMYAGDPDADYPDQFTTNPIFGHTIYIVFIVLIGIILQNLLIALAVNDLQRVQQEAIFIEKKERAEYVTSIERIIFGKYRDSSTGFRHIFKKLLVGCDIFNNSRILVIQPYNSGCVYAQDNPSKKEYIKNQDIIDYLQNIFKDLNFKDKETEEHYSLKALYEKLERIENLLQNLNATSSL